MKHFLRSLLILCAVSVGTFLPAHAQEKTEVLWDASLHFFFDNREYKSELSTSQTLFGMRLAPETGLRFDDFYSVMVGMNFLADYGAHPAIKANDYIAYFQYRGKKINCFAGLIPRSKSICNYAYAFFNDSISYYDPNLSGALLQYRGKSGYVEFGVDWNSMRTGEKREKFLLFLGSRIQIRSFYAGLQASMYHHARSHLYKGVVDNMLLYPHIGLDLATATRFDQFDVRAGWMQAFQNDRTYVGKYVTPNGFQLDVHLERWHFGVKNTLYAGKNLMPYWEATAPNLDYGHGLYWGEPFYRTDSMYDRLELYWQPHISNRLFLRVSSIHHYDGHCWSWQQKVSFKVRITSSKTQ